MQYRYMLAAVAAAAALAAVACRGSDAVTSPSASAAASSYEAAQHQQHASLPIEELAEAKAAAARYHDIRQAIADGYHDTGIVLPNMGRHFLNQDLLDTRFEANRPELLVYTPDSSKLLAVEYAQPLTATPPEGFAGDADRWVPFGGVLWTLHAWVWKDNPDGVFNPTNTRVP
jgi:hypothetical protein